ncbi:Hypothetical predicted protein [Drosophila guanche]|uniref:Uncharacterized protein n=1 Tax=Drosophila guanche TaxID=7266 RepID=A0A3B0K867_DROGU|nr:Hypothetical predicted protein [Drosophila guanche]
MLPSDTLIDALSQLGLSVEYEGTGDLLFDLINLRIAGTLKYKAAHALGSAKITSLKTTISLESVKSDISGFMGHGSLNRAINSQLENVVVKLINDNQQGISDTIVPRVNKMLKGKDLWTDPVVPHAGRSDKWRHG